MACISSIGGDADRWRRTQTPGWMLGDANPVMVPRLDGTRVDHVTCSTVQNPASTAVNDMSAPTVKDLDGRLAGSSKAIEPFGAVLSLQEAAPVRLL